MTFALRLLDRAAYARLLAELEQVAAGRAGPLSRILEALLDRALAWDDGTIAITETLLL